MRLIDLDQKIFVPIVDESKGGVEYEMEMTVGEMFDKFLGGFQPEIVDAVPVVRCRDCKHWMKQIDSKLGGFGICANLGGGWDGNEFCSDGERRDEGAADRQ